MPIGELPPEYLAQFHAAGMGEQPQPGAGTSNTWNTDDEDTDDEWFI